MEKKERAPFVSLTEGEYIYLLKKYGEAELRKRMNRLSRKKKNDREKQTSIKSDYRAIISEGMQVVEPIRDKYLIESMKELLLEKSERDWFLFFMGINTGLRISDLLGLRVVDVKDCTHIIIKETKTKKAKKFLLNHDLRRVVNEYTAGMELKNYLFPSFKTGLPIQRVQAYKVLKAAAEELSIPHFGCHSMRKTFGFFHYLTYHDVALLQQIFNHSTPEITLRYIGINQEIIDKSLESFSL